LPALSEWLQLMLAEIARKREELEHARSEQARRELERTAHEPVSAATAEAAREHGAATDRAARR
jgi:hypothetical protein